MSRSYFSDVKMAISAIFKACAEKYWRDAHSQVTAESVRHAQSIVNMRGL